MRSKVKALADDYRLLLNNVPAFVTVAFVVSTILMNFAASKVIFQWGKVAMTGGVLLSWTPFLCMDTVTKRFGARASIMLNVLSAVGNVFAVLFMHLIAIIPGNGQDYSSFNSVYTSVWFIVLGSTVAFVISGVANSLLNVLVGKIFKKNPNGGFAFFIRSYVSTFIGQAIDNFLFMFIVYVIFAPIYWGFGMDIATCIGTAIVGGFLELLVEIVFSPLGLKVVRHWEREKVGQAYIDAHATTAE